jgi:aminopeptidase N
MREPSAQVIQLKDYTPPAFLIPETELSVDIHPDHARVRARLTVERNPAAADQNAPLELDGEELQLESLSVDGRMLSVGEFEHDDKRLVIAGVPSRFILETSVRISPQTNTQFMGLYASRAGYFTQCEAQGFRRITWFMDRPDVMSRYTVTISADKETCPVLLSNGNLDSSGDAEGGRHWARWVDPFRKPCYLFAMVAGRLDVLEGRFTTRSGREVKLAIYVDPGKLDQCGFAMQALKRAMRWDEEVFGLELDLDQYMIVAVGDFNMGAMENKGLNIFNTKYVLARPDTATDTDFMQLDRVVAHEYFHNWTGNRVTCRDWFQLSLKEGLTVFRDQEYGADTYSRPVQRIQEVRGLRGAQFPEDAGPMAHPVRPPSYMEISNFYTATVYEKGAEVVRMIHTLIGAEYFRKGMDLYFQRHDGQAVTCDDFVAAMADASGADLGQFKRWYDQAGTPVLEVSDDYDADARRYTLTLRQSCPPTPESAEKQPFHIPLALGLVSPEGTDYALRLEGENQAGAGTRVLSITEPEQRLVFEDVPARPVPSLLRGFSAPVILKYGYGEEALTHLIANDSDSFNRWEAGQQLAARLILRGAAAMRDGGTMEISDAFVHAFGRVLADATRPGGDPAFAAEALAMPAEAWLAEQMDTVDPDSLHAARLALRRRLAHDLKIALMLTWDVCESKGSWSADPAAAARRALKNLCLGLLMELDDPGIRARCMAQFESADNMTDQMAALTALANNEAPERSGALGTFFARWKDEPLVVDKWLSVQALSRLPGTLEEVKRLTQHPAFDIRNPNKVYALIRGFCANHVRFHAADGSGYAFAADRIIELDGLNPQVAARVARSFDRWKRFDHHRQVHARAALERIRDKQGLSKDVAEIVGRAFGG